MKFCKDCKWFIPSDSGLTCGHGKAVLEERPPDPIFGMKHMVRTGAYDMRDVNHECGPDALLFEEKVK